MVKVRSRIVAERLAPVISPLSTGELAQGAQCTKEQTTKWRAGRMLPNTAALLSLGRHFAEVRGWAITEMADEQLLMHLASYPGPEGEAARRALAENNTRRV